MKIINNVWRKESVMKVDEECAVGRKRDEEEERWRRKGDEEREMNNVCEERNSQW